MRVLWLMPLLVLAACTSVSPAGVDARLGQWYGQPVERLLDKWGVPDRVEQLEPGRSWLVYQNRKRGSGPHVGLGVGAGSGNVFGSVSTLLYAGPDSCTRQVESRNGRVSKIRWQGDAKLCWELSPAPAAQGGQ
ncbi:hypothetical protein [Gallaecimonas sp. GXIMD4217]|uniref:hypothetical protein n=1 Tax=Gallaecimonas sp. GXIMD4217 TaxID=3131927 RepID=UPI00311AD3B0